MTTSNATVSLEQKRVLYRDGYIVTKNAVPDDLVKAALPRIKAAQKGKHLGGEQEPLDLLNTSSLTPILNGLVGTFDPPTRGQVGVRKATKPGDHFAQLGYREKVEPYYARRCILMAVWRFPYPRQFKKVHWTKYTDALSPQVPKATLAEVPM